VLIGVDGHLAGGWIDGWDHTRADAHPTGGCTRVIYLCIGSRSGINHGRYTPKAGQGGLRVLSGAGGDVRRKVRGGQTTSGSIFGMEKK
jgi:hypothetical protein